MSASVQNWWIHGEARPGMRRALKPFSRFIATPRVSRYRLFVWLTGTTLPDCQLVVIARDDDTTFGILHSHLHELGAAHGHLTRGSPALHAVHHLRNLPLSPMA